MRRPSFWSSRLALRLDVVENGQFMYTSVCEDNAANEDRRFQE